MNHQDVFELIPAYALDALDPAEAEAVARHLEACPACREEMAAFTAVADALPLALPEAAPSPRVREQLLARAGAATAARPVAPPPTAERPAAWWARVRRAPLWQPVALALIALLLVSNVVLWQRLNAATRPSPPITLTATDNAPGALGVLVPGADARVATLVISGLPALAADQQYQLWLIEDGTRTSGAVFSVAADGSVTVTVAAPQPLSRYSAFGITVEPAGGSPGPTGPRVLGHNL